MVYVSTVGIGYTGDIASMQLTVLELFICRLLVHQLYSVGFMFTYLNIFKNVGFLRIFIYTKA